MVALAEEFRERYRDRVILYDAPSLLSQGDAMGFLPHVESVLLVVRDGAVRTEDLKHAMELLKDCNLMVHGSELFRVINAGILTQPRRRLSE